MKIVIIGAGLSGLSAANALAENGDHEITIVEKKGHIGGMAYSFTFDDLLFDTGPHRFHTQNKFVKKYILDKFSKDEIAEPIKKTKIYYNNKFLNYPLKISDILFDLSPIDSIESLLSYIYYKAKKHLTKVELSNFDDFIKYNFGEKLNKIYFRQYTEKVWQMSAKDLSMEWAKERIPLSSFKDLVLKTILSSFRRNVADRHSHSPYQSNFYYPNSGIFEISKRLLPRNCDLIKNFNVKRVIKSKDRIIGIENENTIIEGDYFVFTNPISEISQMILDYTPRKLNYLEDNLYCVPIEKCKVSDNHWIYFPGKNMIFNRITEMKNFTDNLPKERTSLILEIGKCRDNETKIFNEAIKQLISLGLIHANQIKKDNFTSITLEQAYPIYEIGYQDELNAIFSQLKFSNMSLAGRQSLFAYINMDQAILSGLNAAKRANIMYEGN